ncbi:hypothetical protein CDCA_CDCA19G4739 [Cyanidium caldarium]|uniref:Bromo domain-containing protein n=1 Tax=Cyanidium caldarium TaxID=2771 RepID=A0AAV9J310_CYACA|nr:hypothetical protein CDCA_CDCA19G4739 [Cyanidium caldarium]
MVLDEPSLEQLLERRREVERECVEVLNQLAELEADDVVRLREQAELARERINATILEVEHALREEEHAHIDAEATARLNDPTRLVIRRVPRSLPPEQRPPNATSLARPAGTGVDFTRLPAQTDYRRRIRQPMFLNNVRDKARKNTYTSLEAFLDDMRLMRDNTREFNRDPSDEWIWQHADLLLEAAEERAREQRERVAGAVQQLADATRELQQLESHLQVRDSVAKERLLPGTDIEVYFAPKRVWRGAAVLSYHEDTALHEVFFAAEQTVEQVNLEKGGVRWRRARVGYPPAPPPRENRPRNLQAALSATAGHEAAGSKRQAAAPDGSARRAAVATGAADGMAPPSITSADLQALRNELFARLEAMTAAILSKLEAMRVPPQHSTVGATGSENDTQTEESPTAPS